MTQDPRSFWRLALSVTGAALVTGALWTLVPDQLSISSDIVNSLIFNGRDVVRYDYGFYFIAFLFPLLAIALFCLLARTGPLRYPEDDRPPRLPLRTEGPSAGGDAAPPRPSVPDTGPGGAGSDGQPTGITVLAAVWALARVGLPMATVVLEVDGARAPRLPHGLAVDILVAVAYAAVVALLTLGFRASDARGTRTDAPVGSTLRASLARANSLSAVVVVPLLYPLARSTSVSVGSPVHVVHVVHLNWLPWWVVAVATAVGLTVWAIGDRRAGGPDGRRGLEAAVLTWVVGPVALFLGVAVIPPALGAFGAFDDAHFLVGPQLVFQHGLFPWKDVYLLHGLLADLFDGKIGMILFGNTRWGANAGMTLLVTPANWIALYCFAAYFCRRNRLLLVGLSVAVVCGLVQGNSPRFLLLPIVFITFDAVLRQPTWRRCWLFMASLVVGTIVTPEQALFTPCLLLPLIVFEAAGRPRTHSIRRSFPRTWRCAVAGLVLSAAWLALLAGTGSLGAFFDYIRVFSNGYGLEGRLPTQWDLATQLMITFAWVIPVVLWLATVWRVTTRVRLRQVWAVTDWVMVAAAATSAIYYPQALDRADTGHVYQSFWVSLPLLILWSIEVLSVADRAVRSNLRRLPAPGSSLRIIGLRQARHVATFAAVVAIIAGTAGRAQTIPFVVGNVSGDFHPTVPADTLTSVPRLGYTVPGAVDTVQIRELQAMLDRYAGPTAPVFDYSNEPGIVYYLLNRVPGTRYSHVDEVQTPAAQREVVAELQQSRPRVVVFSNRTFGLLSYDGIPQAVRSSAVSSYLYAHYRPLLDAAGQLLLLRDDLFASAPPVPPGFGTSDLYFDTPNCTFGDIPNFLPPPAGIEALPHVGIPVTVGATDLATTVTGWALDAATPVPATRILAVVDGHVIASAVPTRPRPDVAEGRHDPSALESGFTLTIRLPHPERPELFAVNADGTVSPLAPSPGPETKLLARVHGTTLVTPDGKVHAERATAATGNIDSAVRTRTTRITLHLPITVTTASYYWLEVSASAPFGTSSFTLSDEPGHHPGHLIEFNTLPRAGSHIYVGTGSCLQWQGYRGRRLYLESGVPPPHLSVTLVK